MLLKSLCPLLSAAAFQSLQHQVHLQQLPTRAVHTLYLECKSLCRLTTDHADECGTLQLAPRI